MRLTAETIMARADGPVLRRAEVRSIDEDARTVDVAFASSTPVDRWFGQEVLSISTGAIRTDRLTDGGAVLMDHDWRDHVGVVVSVRIDAAAGLARATLRLGRSARAEEVWQDIVDGIRRHVSVAYRVWTIEVEEREGQSDLVTVTDWEPHEISFVAVPADTAVGVGRMLQQKGTESMPTATQTTPPAVADPVRSRAEDLASLGRQFGAEDLACRGIAEGWTTDQLLAELRARQSRRGSAPLSADGLIGMSGRDLDSYSIMRLIRYIADPSPATAQAAAMELEASRAVAQTAHRDPEGVHVPLDVLADPRFTRRDLATGTTAGGGALVATELLAGSFVDRLRERTVIFEAGALILDGLIGNIGLPRLTGSAALEWVAEAGAPSDSDMTFDVVSLSPHTLSAAVPVTRRMLLQSTPDVEAVIRLDLTARIAREIERAALGYVADPNGPDGLKDATISALPWATATRPTYAEVVELATLVAEGSGDSGNLAYIGSARIAGNLRGTPIEAGAPGMIWRDEPDGAMVAGHPAYHSALLAADELFFGNWSDLVVGFWSGLDLRLDTATLAASDGLVVRAFQDLDVGVRHPESFALGQNP